VNNPYIPPTTELAADEAKPYERICKEVARPATALIIMSSIHCVFDSLAFCSYFFLPGEITRHDIPQFLITITIFGIHLFQCIAAAQLGFLKSISIARVGAILTVIPFLSPFVVLGIPFGIWALVLLARQDVKIAFAQSAAHRMKID